VSIERPEIMKVLGLLLEESVRLSVYLPDRFVGGCVSIQRPEVMKILGSLPDKSTRQTVLFSATFPRDIKQLCEFALRPGSQMVNTTGEEETHSASQASRGIMRS
jgi:hypothetical protein